MAIDHLKPRSLGAWSPARPLIPPPHSKAKKPVSSIPGRRESNNGTSKQEERAGTEVTTTNQWGDLDGEDAQLPAQPLGPGSTSHVARLTRELKALEVRYFRTRLQLEKVTDKNDQLRQESTKCRSRQEKTERENTKLRHLIDRIQSEKKQVEAQAVHNRDYVKKIEQRFFMGSKGQSLVQCNLELSDRVKSMKREISENEAAFAAQQHELEDTQAKLAIVKRALETRFEELHLNGSLHHGILYELSRLQDQNASMARQLGEERKVGKTLEVQLDQANAKHTELEEALVVRDSWIASLDSERSALADRVATQESEQQTSAVEKATLLKFIQEQAELKFQLEASKQRMQDAHAAEKEDFHVKLQQGMEERQTLQTSIHELTASQREMQRECQRVEECWQAERSTTEELRKRQHELYLELERLQTDLKQKDDEFLAAKDVCQELQSEIDRLQRHECELSAQVQELEATVARQQAELAQKQQEQTALQSEMETALRELEAMSGQRNEAARAMNEAVAISASSLDEQQSLETKIETQRQQLEQLKHSKNLLQNAMLEQLSGLRKQLQVERVKRIECEAKLKQIYHISPLKSPRRVEGEVGSASCSPVSPASPVDGVGDKQRQLDDSNEDMEPLPPPEISSSPSILPLQLSLMCQAASLRPSSVSSSSKSSRSQSPSRSPLPLLQPAPIHAPSDDSLTQANAGDTLLPSTPSVANLRTHDDDSDARVEREDRRAAHMSDSSIPSPTDTLSLLELAGN